MGLLSRRESGVDVRDRDYVLTHCPLVAQDDQVLLVDITVRLAVREATNFEDLVLGYNQAEETAMHAICVLVLRQLAADVPSGELLTARSRMAEALERAFAFAPVGVGVEPHVLSVEVRPYVETPMNTNYEFRVVRS